ncbi:MAG: hypothetical protein OSB69_17905 [Alphaproteobacteria bacterium]|nr:hypothetical protein [Alphaproteobacteria bacterium]
MTEDSTVVHRVTVGAPLIGDPTQLLTITGWRPHVDFEAMVLRMITEAG